MTKNDDLFWKIRSFNVTYSSLLIYNIRIRGRDFEQTYEIPEFDEKRAIQAALSHCILVRDLPLIETRFLHIISCEVHVH